MNHLFLKSRWFFYALSILTIPASLFFTNQVLHIMIKFYFVLLLSFITLSGMAQITVTGKVTNNQGEAIPGATVVEKGTSNGTMTHTNGTFSITVSKGAILIVQAFGLETQEVTVGTRTNLDITLAEAPSLSEIVVVGHTNAATRRAARKARRRNRRRKRKMAKTTARPEVSRIERRRVKPLAKQPRKETEGTKKKNESSENTFLTVKAEPLSTFSVDVDNASYSMARRSLNFGNLPATDQVRIEEFINYFDYKYPQPKGKHPFAVVTEMAKCPWNKERHLVHIGLKGKNIAPDKLKPSNLVFLLDVSGSMMSYDKLPLLKKAFKVLVNNLQEKDRVAIVVYAGAAGLVLPSTSGQHKRTIMKAINNLQAGGSTAGGAGIRLAYKVAKDNFIKGGNNRVILATDGDFNVGASSDQAMQELIEEKRKEGVFITTLGFGTGNYQDSKMETIADKGNSNYYYLDSFNEAYKVFNKQLTGTLYTIAKDVKLQVEFNPTMVKSYRLIGYENRLLDNEDFKDDTKDAGEIGAGHTVTALYEVALYEKAQAEIVVNEKRWPEKFKPTSFKNQEVLNVWLRYKKPNGRKSIPLNTIMNRNDGATAQATENFRFSAAVAAFGMLLRNSKYAGKATYKMVKKLARSAKGKDEEGYRAEFIQLVKKASVIQVK